MISQPAKPLVFSEKLIKSRIKNYRTNYEVSEVTASVTNCANLIFLCVKYRWHRDPDRVERLVQVLRALITQNLQIWT
jgi:hypothetical protein